MLRAKTQNLAALPSYRYGEETYDPNKLGLGYLMRQRSGPGAEDSYVGPLEHRVFRYFETYSVTSSFPWAMTWVDTPTKKIDWIFTAETSSAAATRRLMMYTYDKLLGVISLVGLVTLTYPAATSHAIRGFRMLYDKYTTGTVSVSGQAVTGVGTSFVSSGMAAGGRIGFGSVNPADITTWYEIASVQSDTGLTLGTSVASALSAGTPYVIEELRAVTATTNATLSNGGLYLTKGLSPTCFTNPTPTVIPAATTVDGIRAVYWLKTAATETLTAAVGVLLQDKANSSTHYCWLASGSTTLTMAKFNLRAALTLSSGASTNALVMQTLASPALTGALTANNNGKVLNLPHGPGAGLACGYFVTATRVVRTKELDSIPAGDSSFIVDSLVPTWPAGSTSMNSSTPSSLSTGVEYASSLDLLVVANVAANLNRTLLTKYKTDASPMDRMMGTDDGVGVVLTADGSTYPLARYVTTSGSYVENGILYTINSVGSANDGWLAACAIGADWEYAATTKARVLLPKITLPAGARVTGVLPKDFPLVSKSGAAQDYGYNMAAQTEPYRVLYRTSGIDDDSGAWTKVPYNGVMAVDATVIQYALEFRAMARTMAHCARVACVTTVYEDGGTLDNYAFDATKSSAASKQFAFWHSQAFGTSVPALRIRVYDAVTGSLLVDDNTSAPTGTWERTTDGTAWSAWTNEDRANATTWLRYTPASIADNVRVYAVLTAL